MFFALKQSQIDPISKSRIIPRADIKDQPHRPKESPKVHNASHRKCMSASSARACVQRVYSDISLQSFQIVVFLSIVVNFHEDEQKGCYTLG